MILPVILSGGSGSRLWPVSREHYPKQFQRLNSAQHSLLQEAALRLEGVEGALPPLIVCNEAHRFLVAEQLHSLGVSSARIMLEPFGRNTAPALALAALAASESDPTSLLLVMPADHVIERRAAFLAAIEQGRELAEEGQLVTFGIQPASPHTGYGYIRRGEMLGTGYRVDAFVEKPDRDRAQAYLDSGDYLWNSGIFLFSAERYLEELKAQAPDIHSACLAAYAGRREDLDFLRVDGEAFGACRSESIDYAVMEKTHRAAVVPMDPGWSDIGAWDAIFALKSDPAACGNAVQGDVLLHDTHDSLIHSQSRLVATVGVQDLVVVETEDAVLVAHRSRAQETKHIVEALKASGRCESQALPQVYRPWGHYRTMVLNEGFQVKEIVVKPGAKLSLQMHHHRAEHWIVVAGTARVTLGDGHGDCEHLRSFLLSEDESTYIPLGTVHRLENPGVIPLRLIEVQTGCYLGEDDIVRFDDAYGRVPESRGAAQE
ncbi:mannose-1-phosphate guanylyltransferase/mannose-6-phosphate isomerase [Halomonas campisalis]|uniref:mannose-1-phosphate guanylyltransferase n=1 Tax=Billgrantia campisalis TaxID=74661 RepID=A0ABS9P8D5_9GAMM|nr:mannose-1-phosphate guanylyltransferase/mannose-6-phosphate isomerase [Halomonas campisalis]MCG6658032.1 mannose-1-phosphate guanylyltransferase/mannose-6-phosphate isomerase [Halomonas campisalis]MDR5862699.1 mannose-1-phosphate guanylyltransferase/mannose-6-phosphate isomerase [Halomonas campisalis]